MRKKFLIFCLVALVGCFLAACGPQNQDSQGNPSVTDASQETDRDKTNGQETDKDKEHSQGGDGANAQEPILDADATDEELLDLVKDDINVVAKEDYAKTVKDMKDDAGKYSGQLYQLEGYYTQKGGTPYITDTLEGEAGESLPLRYVAEEPEEGAQIRITGVISEGSSEDGTEESVTLDVVVLEPLGE